MQHLNIDEIIEFISLRSLDQDAMALAAKVNGHMRSCRTCFETVRAFQTVYDAFEKLERKGDFKQYLLEEGLAEQKSPDEEQREQKKEKANFPEHDR